MVEASSPAPSEADTAASMAVPALEASGAGGGTARRRRKEARPQELLDAALDLFVEKGYAATRAEEVARRAGVSKGTLYLYYPSKEELFKAVVRQNLAALIAEGEELVDEFSGSSPDLLTELTTIWWQRVGATRASAIIKIVMAEARNFPDLAAFYRQEVIEPGDRLFSRVVQRGIDRGEFRALPVAEVSHAICTPLIFNVLVAHSWGCCPSMDGTAGDPLRALLLHIDLLLHGLRRDPPPPRPTHQARA